MTPNNPAASSNPNSSLHGHSISHSNSISQQNQLADDGSVLPVPSHVVLHHLGTSAIRNGVLAVADTVRYRKKVCISFRTDVIKRLTFGGLFAVHYDDLL